MKKVLLLLAIVLPASHALAADADVCGSLSDVIIESTNPPGSQLQITIVDSKNQRLRKDLSQSLSERPDTIQLLMKALDNSKLKVCLNNFVSEKGYQTLGVLKK